MGQGIATIACDCGTVRGTVARAAPRFHNRVICYCRDCQAFALALGRPDLVNEAGGSDIVQLAASRLRFSNGTEQIRGLRLTPAGTMRWYAACCRTPLGNMGGPKQPALGILVRAFRLTPEEQIAILGTPIGAIRGEQATLRQPRSSHGVPLGVMARAVPKVLGWILTGRGRPNPFVGTDGSPLYPLEVLRDANS